MYTFSQYTDRIIVTHIFEIDISNLEDKQSLVVGAAYWIPSIINFPSRIFSNIMQVRTRKWGTDGGHQNPFVWRLINRYLRKLCAHQRRRYSNRHEWTGWRRQGSKFPKNLCTFYVSSKSETIPRLIWATYCVEYLQARPFLRNKMPYSLLKHVSFKGV